MSKKKICVVGAGPGGLTAAMLLASKGYQVEVFEKQSFLGGRTSSFGEKGFTFDLGPTFLMMKFILDEMFELTGRSIEDYLDCRTIDPLYRLVFGDGTNFLPSVDQEKTIEQIAKLFPGEVPGYKRYMAYEKTKFERLTPCLQIPYEKYSDLFKMRLIRALPYLDAHKSVYAHLGDFFDHPFLKISFTFQSKYLGMSPWDCPGLFSMISYIEHGLGIFHPIGGLNQITKAMQKVLEEEGGKIHLNTGVKEILVQNRKAKGLLLENGEKIDVDDVIINADFADAMTKLVQKKDRPKYTDEKLARMKYSCSTFMLYLGVDKQYDIPHHNIIFAEDYQRNLNEISQLKVLSKDPSFYIQNATVTDPGLAPEGQSTIYVLVPVPNNKSKINWAEEKEKFRELVLHKIEEKGSLPDLQKHIVWEKVITPYDWEHTYHIYNGATFNLGHNVGQMLMWRPHNRFEELDNCFLVGGGTHPGSGLPTIFESGRISSGIILKRDLW